MHLAMRLDAIFNRAREDLVINTEQRDQDVFVWEHSVRVTEMARKIAALPPVREAEPDEAAIIAAALYHEAGWIMRLRDGEITRVECLLGTASETQREQGAIMMERSLAKLLPAESLARASQIIRTLHSRDIEPIEGQVVRDADNLDGFGLLSLWAIIRRGAVEGKGVQAVLDTWQAQRLYHFWEARLKDSFLFPAVRAIAERRLEKFERFMGQLRQEHQGEDITFGAIPERTGRTAE
jgi:HD superfamily phosphodiesterase